MRKALRGFISLVFVLAMVAAGSPADAGHLNAGAAVDKNLVAEDGVVMFTFTATNNTSSDINEISSDFHVPPGTSHVGSPDGCPVEEETFTNFCTSPGAGANSTHSEPGDVPHDGTVVRGSSDPDEPLLKPGESLIYRVFIQIDNVEAGSKVCNEHHATARSGTLGHLTDDSDEVCTRVVDFVKLNIDVLQESINALSASDKGVIGVAVLSSTEFDATTLDLREFRFGSCDNPEARDTTLAHDGTAGHVQDANGDGVADLVGHWNTPETGIKVGDTEACLDLQPQFVDRTYYFGSDDIKTI